MAPHTRTPEGARGGEVATWRPVATRATHHPRSRRTPTREINGRTKNLRDQASLVGKSGLQCAVMRVAFGEIVFDLDSRRLFRGPKRLKINPTAATLLLTLLKRRPAAVPRRELLRTLWPNVKSPPDSDLTAYVHMLRKTVGDSQEKPHWILENRQGVTFIGEAQETEASPGDRRIFLSYRRDDSADAAGRLRDMLVDAYGSKRVFQDIKSVPLGTDFVDHVAGQISRCSAVIVMIGKQWLKVKDKRRRRRLDNDDDLVRAEIVAALQQKIPVIPVLVQNAKMPTADDLPENIRLLARRNGIELSATRWKTDVERLIKELDRVMKE